VKEYVIVGEVCVLSRVAFRNSHLEMCSDAFISTRFKHTTNSFVFFSCRLKTAIQPYVNRGIFVPKYNVSNYIMWECGSFRPKHK
jgi:hypothetical protein